MLEAAGATHAMVQNIVDARRSRPFTSTADAQRRVRSLGNVKTRLLESNGILFPSIRSGGPAPGKMCEGCKLKVPFYGLASEGKARWCAGCGEAAGAVSIPALRKQQGLEARASLKPASPERGEESAPEEEDLVGSAPLLKSDEPAPKEPYHFLSKEEEPEEEEPE
jgi:hypothetical protein